MITTLLALSGWQLFGLVIISWVMIFVSIGISYLIMYISADYDSLIGVIFGFLTVIFAIISKISFFVLGVIWLYKVLFT